MPKLLDYNTVFIFDYTVVKRIRKALIDWVKKVDLEIGEEDSPQQVALDETVVNIGGEIFRLYLAVDPEIIETILTQLFSTRKTALTEPFLRELRSKHDVEDATSLVEGAPCLQIALERLKLEYRHETVGDITIFEYIIN